VRDDAEDEDLNVDGDDTVQFGQAQFSETDLVQMSTEDDGDDDIPLSKVFAASKGGGLSSKSGFFVVESLKLRIKDLERSVANIPQCKICLGGYNTPLVSINCWHVHCEQCWMATLGAKKLCPQCKVITCPGDLRRIYL